MKSRFKKYIPTKQSIMHMKEFKIFKTCWKSSYYWDFNCQSVARGMAAGLGAAVIPGFQIFYAILLVILFRGNIPVALLSTLVTNPLTVIPIMFVICSIGSLIISNDTSNCTIHNFVWDFSSFQAFFINFNTWMLQFGKAFLVGVPIASVCLIFFGYFGTILIWKVCSFLFGLKK